MTLCSLDWHRASRAAVFRMNSNPTPIFLRTIARSVISDVDRAPIWSRKCYVRFIRPIRSRRKPAPKIRCKENAHAFEICCSFETPVEKIGVGFEFMRDATAQDSVPIETAQRHLEIRL